jgi:DnaJ-domain-containing protein 1
MTIPRRLIRIAQRTLADLADGLSEPAHRADARDELESYLAGPGRRPTASSTAPPPPPDPLKPYYDALGAPVGADLATVEKIWRRCVLKNHPDRFMHDPAEQKRAADRLRKINDAHDVLDRELRRRETSASRD